MNAAVNISSQGVNTNVEPVLRRVLQEARKEHQQMNEMFALMGWEGLPDALKIEIKDDISAMVKELKGQYSTRDPHVERRRRRVVYWVDMFKDGACSKQTAIDALRVRSL